MKKRICFTVVIECVESNSPQDYKVEREMMVNEIDRVICSAIRGEHIFIPCVVKKKGKISVEEKSFDIIM